jgi:signal transduction histidine kinase
MVIPEGLRFTADHGGLHVEPWLSGKPLIANRPTEHARSIGIPPGHPPLRTLLGLPLYYGTACVGVLELANRREGYSEHMIAPLSGVCSSVAVLLELFSARALQSVAAATEEPRLALHSLELSSAVVQSISEAIVVTDAELVVRLLNRAASRLLLADGSEEALVGASIRTVLSESIWSKIDWVQLAADFCQQPRAAASHLTGARGEGVAKDLQGHDVPVNFSISSFLFAQRRYFCFILSDIRHRKQYEEKMQMLAFLSHELRNPLQIILSGLQELQFRAAAEEHVGLLIDASNSVSRVINGVLDLSRLEHAVLRDSSFSIEELVQQALRMIRAVHSNPEVILRWKVEASVPSWILADEVSLLLLSRSW